MLQRGRATGGKTTRLEAEASSEKGERAMPKKKQAQEIASEQVVFRLGQPLRAAVLMAAQGLGLDLSNLLRMMIAEHVAEYIGRGKRAAAALEQARAEAQSAPAEVSETPEGGRQARKAPGQARRTILVDTAEK
jgi:hypothetical protein